MKNIIINKNKNLFLSKIPHKTRKKCWGQIQKIVCKGHRTHSATRVEIAKFLPYCKFGPNLENYYLATTWRMSWMWHEANLDPCSIVVVVTAPPTLAVLVILDRLQS